MTRRQSSCLSFAFVGKFSCLIIPLHESLWYITRFLYFLEFGTYSINATHPKTRKILQLLRLRQVLHETHPLWYYKMATGYCSFYLCFCVGHDDKYILLKAKAGSDYLLIVPGSFSESTRFLSYLSLSSLGHSLQIFEPKLKHLVSRCLGVSTFFILTF